MDFIFTLQRSWTLLTIISVFVSSYNFLSFHFFFVDLKITHVRFWSRFSISSFNLAAESIGKKKMQKKMIVSETRDALINTFLVTRILLYDGIVGLLDGWMVRVVFFIKYIFAVLLSKNWFFLFKLKNEIVLDINVSGLSRVVSEQTPFFL